MIPDMRIHQLVSELKATLDRVAAVYAQGTEQDTEDFVVLRGSVESVIDIAAASIQMFNLEAIQPSPEVIAANQSRVRGDQEPCVVCGKPVRDVMKLQVHLSNHGNIYPCSIDAEAASRLPEGTMYFYPVGPDCSKKIPTTHLHKEGK